MADEGHEEPAKSVKRWVCVIVPVVYVLSFGPVTWLFSFGLLPLAGWQPYVFRAVYSPLFWLAERAVWFKALLVWYQNLF